VPEEVYVPKISVRLALSQKRPTILQHVKLREDAQLEFIVAAVYDRRTKLMRRSQSAATITMALKSFIEVAPDSHFPIQNLLFGVFQPTQGESRVGVAIGLASRFLSRQR
jgi:hypothetical protein